MSIGDNIREKRWDRRLTQKALAKKCGISKSMMCEIENGRKTPSLPVMIKIAKVLKSTIDDLV